MFFFDYSVLTFDIVIHSLFSQLKFFKLTQVLNRLSESLIMIFEQF